MCGNLTELPHCISRIDTTLGGDWKSYEELLLWMLALGTVASSAYEYTFWFSVRFLTQANKLGIHEYDQLTRICAKYFWLDHLE
jgi:hypothetical protein